MKRLWDYYKNLLWENRGWFRAAGWGLVIAFFLGMGLYYLNQDLLSAIIKVFEEKFGVEPALDFNLAWQIFIQNTAATAIALFLGILFGIAPFLIVGLNGVILGYVLAAIAAYEDNLLNVFYYVVTGLLPHGILEIPAFLLASAFGLKLGISWLSKGAAGQRQAALKKSFLEAAAIFPIVVVLLFLAALLEVFVSGKLLN
ncbi:MAG: hypothetical protein A3H72_03915 [Candidatus Doudnabacteria bacterium RIFCSPLOWO2_02_FULL_48_8]|uniref:Stage II sporulation protein M n=1 Tax=Candidatus Doudnabacteria bacterium RIFCSPHIGHO2_01_FULL_46_24 TaxID=1817825 RepID=A0A1F5NVZ8_9BACT|nr:MAG: hypothetical protein A2720_02130 [Candidatus Doudnabacteria bacterium RIFCSPHIGHO2_01_FULL_46_24]OGE95147.1 MAG: hypothetical protein A3H72_03915 [Candidatus Doudnabacteria bacterium RIFCSPLOWO2_02_FULL_48_8]OGE95529.1 MAG: hypothetical protein A3E98_01810 [Candidatus Doudnabacteria bacterium RIFCSPHIGHO2_12_FULL_48_11]